MTTYSYKLTKKVYFINLSFFSTHRKSQLASSQRVLSNIMIGWKHSQRACELAFAMSGKEPLRRFSTWRICSREQAKSECDWLVMSSVFVASQSGCFFLCSREQIRQVENRLYADSIPGRFHKDCQQNVLQESLQTLSSSELQTKEASHQFRLFSRTSSCSSHS